MTNNIAANWHKIANTDAETIGAALHEDCIFESPVVHTPQRGKAISTAYLVGANEVLGNDSFEYVNEWTGHNSAILEFTAEIDGIKINGVDMITTDDDGLITNLKVMLRPLKAVNMVHQKMGEALERMRA